MWEFFFKKKKKWASNFKLEIVFRELEAEPFSLHHDKLSEGTVAASHCAKYFYQEKEFISHFNG